MQSIKALSGRLAEAALPRLFPSPVKISRSQKPRRRTNAQTPQRTLKPQRQLLKIERPTWRRKLFSGDIPPRSGLYAVTGFYILVLVTALVFGDAAEKLKSTGQLVAAVSARTFGFGIREIRVEGGSRLSDSEVTKILDITPSSSAFTINTEETRQRFLDIPWIKTASVRLIMPGTLEVNVTERTPYALWQLGGDVLMIDKDGRQIGPYNDQRFSGLPLIVGKGADAQATKLLSALEQYPALQSRLRAAIYVANRRWNLKLSEGTDIKLPEQNFETALSKLAELDKKDALLNRDISIVDLRLPDRVIVRLSEAAAKERDDKLNTKPAAKRAAPAAIKAPVIVQKVQGGRA